MKDKGINSDLQDKPAGVSDSDWQQFKDRRQKEREQITLDEHGLVGNVSSKLSEVQ